MPNARNLFMKPISNWIELANDTAPMYYIEKVSLEKDSPKNPDELFFCVFEMCKQPVIKINTYTECIND